MLGPVSLVDVLFVVTIVLLVFNGFRTGFVFSLVNLLSLPLAFAVAWFFGPQLTQALAGNNLGVAPIIAYLLLFFGTVLVVHIIGTLLRGIVQSIPLVGSLDTLLGGFIGFVEAWLLWVVILVILYNVLLNSSKINVTPAQLSGWQDFYNAAVTNSLFARVNSFIITTIHK